MTPLSKTLEELINEIYLDGNVSVVEYRTLRDDADRRMDAVIQEFGLHNNVTAFQKAGCRHAINADRDYRCKKSQTDRYG